jgi:hypothetical protein
MQPLPFQIDYHASAGALSARITGAKGSIDITLGYWQAIGAEVIRLHPRTLLVIDEMQGEPLPVEQMQHLVDAMTWEGFEQMRVAYVATPGRQMSRVEVAEILARERGFNVRVFSNETDASLWLRYGAH